MSAAADIRAAIVAALEAVPNIGVVQNRERNGQLPALKSLYTSDGRLHGWFVRRLAVQEAARIQPRSVEFTTWRLQGFMAFDDEGASELLFDDVIEGIRDQFRSNDTLGGVVAQCSLPDGSAGGIQMPDAGPVMFAGVLCHAARLVLHTVRYL